MFAIEVVVKGGVVLDYIILRGCFHFFVSPFYIHEGDRILETLYPIKCPLSVAISDNIINKVKRYHSVLTSGDRTQL